MATTAERLAEVDAAITNALQAQAYTAPGGRGKTNANLKDLYAIRNDLAMQLARETSGGMFRPIRFGRAGA